MYLVNNLDCVYVAYRHNYRNTICVEKIGSEKNLIKYLALGFVYNDFFDTFDYDLKYTNKRFDFTYWDGYYRRIEPRIYYNEAFLYWSEHIKNTPISKRKQQNTYIGEFRRKPVEGIRKGRGGSHCKPRKIKTIAAMYANPEYKGFNRGSRDDYPDGWWDDWHRSVERNWKSQRRHQWKETK